MFKVSHSSYTNGQYFRPKPVLIERPDSHLLVVATGWGPLEMTQNAAELVVNQFEQLAQEDQTTTVEVTASVSTPANRLIAGIKQANQYLYKTENAKLWKAAVEITALHYDRGVLSWVHVGSPHVILNDGKNIHPVAYVVDWVAQTGNQGPLFSQALGMDPHVNMTVGSLRLGSETQILLLGRSIMPRSVLSCEKFVAPEIQRLLVDDDPNAPFWLGLVELEDAA